MKLLYLITDDWFKSLNMHILRNNFSDHWHNLFVVLDQFFLTTNISYCIFNLLHECSYNILYKDFQCNCYILTILSMIFIKSPLIFWSWIKQVHWISIRFIQAVKIIMVVTISFTYLKLLNKPLIAKWLLYSPWLLKLHGSLIVMGQYE